MLILTFLLSLYLFSGAQTQSDPCGYDVKGPADVIFIMDASQSVGENKFNDLKVFIKRLITRTMLVGPDLDLEYVRLGFIIFNKTESVPVVDLITTSDGVYQSEFFAQEYGLFDSKVIYDFKGGVSYQNAMAGAFVQAKQFIRFQQGVAPRRKILFLATDAEFKDDTQNIMKGGVQDEIHNLRQIVASQNGTMDMYGIGIGTYHTHENAVNLRKIVEEGKTNISLGSCRSRTFQQWNTYINGLSTHPAKGDLGLERRFASTSLCCILCLTRLPEGDDDSEASVCKANEFDDSSLPELECDDDNSPSGSCSIMEEDPQTTTVETIDDDKPNDTVSLLIPFGIVNLVLVVMFILVCIYAPRIKQKRKPNYYRRDAPEERRSRDNPYTESAENPASQNTTLTPTRTAPRPPTHLVSPRLQVPTRPPPTPDTQGKVNSAYDDDDDNDGDIYQNSDILNSHSLSRDQSPFSEPTQDVDIERQQPDNTNPVNENRKTLFDAFKEDFSKFKNRMSSHFEEGTNSQASSEISGGIKRRPTNPLRRWMNRLSQNYENSDTIQSIHDRVANLKKKPAPKPRFQNLDQSGEMDSELANKLKARLDRAGGESQPAVQLEERQPDIILDTAGTDYVNEDVINEIRQSAGVIQEQVYENVGY